jgi:hypothetical protein
VFIEMPRKTQRDALQLSTCLLVPPRGLPVLWDALQRRNQWQHAAQLVMTAVESPNEQTVAAASRQMELALFLEG